MPRKRYSVEQVINKLREADVRWRKGCQPAMYVVS